MNKAVITPDEADIFLAGYDTWLALAAEVKRRHIARASVYAQTQWTCTSVVWVDDPDTAEDEIDIPAVVKEAVAFYAYADSQNNLFGNVVTADEPRGNLRSLKSSIGDLSDEVTYFKGGVTTPSGTMKSLGYPDSLMESLCTRVCQCTTQVTRV